MAFVRGIFAVIAGLAITALVGGIYDYIRPEPLLDPVNTKFLYPWITGLSGAVGALIAVLVYGPGRRSANPSASRPAPERPQKVKAQKNAKPEPVAKPEPLARPESKPTLETSADVPGMPTFDFDKARKDATPTKEKQ